MLFSARKIVDVIIQGTIIFFFGPLPSSKMQEYIYIYIYIYIYTGCPRRNVPDFGRVFLMLKYTDITQNT